LTLVLLLAAGSAARSASTYPPQPDSRLPARESLDASRVALFAGRQDQAYRLLLLAEPDLEKDPAWLDLATRVYLALDRPGRIAEILLKMVPSDPTATARARAVLERMGNSSVHTTFQAQGRWPITDRKSLKPILAVAPAGQGGAFLLTENGLQRVAPDGTFASPNPLPGGRDLTLDPAGAPLALGESSVLWDDAAIKLPPGITKPVSAAAAPDGSFFVLERGTPRLNRVSRRGASLGSVDIAAGDPVKVRVDRAGRIYIADRDTGQVKIYGADMSVVRTMTLTAGGKPLRKIDDFTLDLAGNLLVTDAATHEVHLYSGAGQLIATLGGESTRVDAAGWDGLGTLVVLDRKDGSLWRYGS